MRIENLISKDYNLTGHGKWLHGVEHDSLVVDTERQLFFWNSKGVSGTCYDWLTKVLGYSHAEAKDYLKENDPNTLYSFIHNVHGKSETIVYPKLVDVFYEEGQNSSKEYWYKRGITDTTIDRFRLGFHDEYYMIPIYQDGLFRNFQCRRDNPKMIKSYYNNVGRLLFNSDILKLTDHIIITEGPTDCLRLQQEGVPCVSHNAGSEGWFPDWFKYFMYQKQIIVCYDNDEAGRTGAKKVAQYLGVNRTKIYTFDGFGDKYDIGDFFNDGFKIRDFNNLIKDQSKYACEI